MKKSEGGGKKIRRRHTNESIAKDNVSYDHDRSYERSYGVETCSSDSPEQLL